MRRRICIFGILAVFVAYCGLAFNRQSVFAVPSYRGETLAILGGATATQWESPQYASKRHQRLVALEARHLQLAAPMEVSGGDRWESDRVLGARDFERLADNGVRRIEVRDSVGLRAFAGRNLRLRHNVSPADGAPLIGAAGAPITKDLLDRCIAGGVTHIAVVGSGSVVGFNATVLMVMLIFVGMTLTLAEIVWEPVMALLDTRRRELAEGARMAIENARHDERIEGERLRNRRQTRDSYRQKVDQAKSDALAEANRILRHAQAHLRSAREDAETRLHVAVREAGDTLDPQIPALAARLMEKIAGIDGQTGARTGRETSG